MQIEYSQRLKEYMNRKKSAAILVEAYCPNA